ncbi:hypothetical protein HCA49_03270 [Listeria booriae]|nr:hypothetical protein [Listeria booriae]
MKSGFTRDTLEAFKFLLTFVLLALVSLAKLISGNDVIVVLMNVLATSAPIASFLIVCFFDLVNFITPFLVLL